MNFQEAESYLFSLGNEVETMKLGLENITALLAALGEPQNNYKKVQVAGTNGKGSVCAFLDSICREANIRTGLYTSPHLSSITERVKIDGVDIAEDEFARLATRVRETSESIVAEGKLSYTPTFFEQVSAVALLAFAEHNVELAILETGLGGRYDAVTAAHAEIAAITRVDLDHQEYLGDTIEEIAAEKAAIIHAGSRAVVLHQFDSVDQVIRAHCRQVGVDPHWASGDIQIRRDRDVAPWLEATIVTERAMYPDILFMGMPGEHQIENASVAVGVIEELVDAGFSIGAEEVVVGMGQARHPGRLEQIGPFLLDGAHNPSGTRALAAYLDEFVSEQPVTLLFGAMRDKAIDEIAAILWPRADQLILTKPSNSRALTAEELAAHAPETFPAENIVETHSVAEAIQKAKEINPDRGVIVVSGSLYLVGEVRKLLLSGPSV